MKNLFSDIYKTSFYSLMIISLGVLLTFQNCGKVKFSSLRPKTVAQSCGTIQMTPSNGLYSATGVTFEVVPATGVAVTDIQWEFTKGNQTVFTSSTNPVTHTFDGATEGPGDYFANVKFIKDDGNGCELTRSFQILDGDLCADPSGISGPVTGFVNEETSPFSIASEACYNGIASWDMDEDGTPDYTHLPVDQPVTHFYSAPGTYTVKAIVISSEDNSQITLTHTINVSYQSCVNPFNSQSVAHGQSVTFAKPSTKCNTACETKARVCNNGEFTGDTTFTQNPSTCKKSGACPPPTNPPPTDPPPTDPPPTTTYAWSTGKWGTCSATKCGTKGTQKRSVVCKSSAGKTVADNNCKKAKPATSKACSAPACPPPVKHFDFASCGFSLTSSNWVGSPGQPKSSYGECEWGGTMTMGSSNKVEAMFFVGDYYDTSGPYGIHRLRNPEQWTITAQGCTIGTIVDPRDYKKKMPNYCRAGGTRTYTGHPMTWNATFTLTHKTTGEVRVIPIKAVFKPEINSGSSGSTPPKSGGTPGGGGSGGGGHGGGKGGLDNTQAR